MSRGVVLPSVGTQNHRHPKAKAKQGLSISLKHFQTGVPSASKTENPKEQTRPRPTLSSPNPAPSPPNSPSFQEARTSPDLGSVGGSHLVRSTGPRHTAPPRTRSRGREPTPAVQPSPFQLPPGPPAPGDRAPPPARRVLMASRGLPRPAPTSSASPSPPLGQVT